ncbi:DUF4383 domain-containing protein [Yinghuangia seranimata]|uniref:DUF4383 domain-containing protein n=1 Tax=Yinghuangia seranimata TaxID=408067 RepID=UPI00248D2AFB|nr:DUF4383 domain-containing protein [Yinghuangia seranimata]MDI2130228.1 DUF4383 domain-containing protein [Yinghuangia seranimata]
MELHDELPVDHRLGRVYRFGAGLVGVFLLVFGILGLVESITFFGSSDQEVAGLSTNGALSTLSIAVGLVLVSGTLRGGNFASNLNIVVGVAFIMSGFVNLSLIGRDHNVLGFHMSNVIFSFAVGVALLAFGMYGRVGSALPHDNPYWRARNPGRAAREDKARQTLAGGGPLGTH